MYARHLKTGEIAITAFSAGGNLSVTEIVGLELSGTDASRTRMSGKSISDSPSLAAILVEENRTNRPGVASDGARRLLISLTDISVTDI